MVGRNSPAVAVAVAAEVSTTTTARALLSEGDDNDTGFGVFCTPASFQVDMSIIPHDSFYIYIKRRVPPLFLIDYLGPLRLHSHYRLAPRVAHLLDQVQLLRDSHARAVELRNRICIVPVLVDRVADHIDRPQQREHAVVHAEGGHDAREVAVDFLEKGRRGVKERKKETDEAREG